LDYSPRIIVNPDGSWSFPESKKAVPAPGAPDPHWPFPTGKAPTPSNVDPNDEEVLRRTTGGIVDINISPLPEIDFEFDLAERDDDLDTSLGPGRAGTEDQQEFEFYRESWVLQGLRMVPSLDNMQDWDCFYTPATEVYWVMTDDPNHGWDGMVAITGIVLQSLKVPMKDYIRLTMAHKEKQ
jgi:hypothetical protein